MSAVSIGHILVFILLQLASASGQARDSVDVIEFTNGQWFDGSGFLSRTVYVTGDRFTSTPKAPTFNTIDLAGKFVIPPLAEAHIHDLNRADTIDERIGLYLDKGIYYVLVQGAMFEITPEIEAKVNRPDSIDVSYVRRTLMTSWSQPVHELILPMAQEGLFGPRRTIEDLDGSAFFVIDSQYDLDSKWSAIKADDSAFLKVRIAFSEQFDHLIGSAQRATPLAVDPELISQIVRRGKEAGKRVSAHIETRADFRLAVEAGVDLITHLPGWQIGTAVGYPKDDLSPWLLTADDAERAAESGVTVITTSLPKLFLPDVAENRPRLRDLHSQNLPMLESYGVTLAIGSDSQSTLVPHELQHLDSFGVFSRARLLEIATDNTAKLIFPARAIGRLQEGYEASFLVLDGNPVESFDNLSRISMRVKQGLIMGEIQAQDRPQP